MAVTLHADDCRRASGARRRRRPRLGRPGGAPGVVARAGRPRVGVGRLDRRRQDAYAWSTAGSTRVIRWSAGSRGVGRASRTTARRSNGRKGDVCGHGTACAGIIRSVAPDCELSACGCSVPGSQAAAGPARRPGLGGRAGLRRHQPEPLDDQGAVRRPSCTSWPTPRTSSAAMIVASAHNMPVRELPVAVRVGRSRSAATRRRTVRRSRQPRRRRSSSSPAASTSTSPGRTARTIRATRQQLRDAAHRRICALILQAPRADAVRAEDACST